MATKSTSAARQKLHPRRPLHSVCRRVLRWLTTTFALLTCALAAPLAAGELDKAGITAHFPPPLVVGERDSTLPIWPLFLGNIARTEGGLQGYAFESIDLAPIAGYAGTPPNMLIFISPDGTFKGVRVLSHREPIFKHGVSEDSLSLFTKQYENLNIKQSIKVAATNGAAQTQAGATAVIDGVSRATVSVRIINEAILAASLKVARAKLGVAPGRDPALAKRKNPDDGTTLTSEEVAAKAYVSKTALDNADVVKSFGPGFVRDVEPGPGTDPKAASTEIWAAYIGVPQIGRAILGKAQFEKLMHNFQEGDHAILIASRGHYGFRGPNQRAGAVPDQLSISQDGLPITVTDAIAADPPESAAVPKGLTWTVLKVIAAAGLDPSRPFQIAMRVTRQNAEIYPRREAKEFPITLQAPADYFSEPEVPLEGWRAVWHDQWRKIALTLTMLGALSGLLAVPKKLAANASRFRILRLAYLALMLVGIGWWGQGQLSILNITALISAANTTGNFGYLLLDPVSLILWVFVIGSLVVFGRGTFCGWLCPFGALQELVGAAADRLGVPQYTVPAALDRVLRLVKYVVLAAILFAAIVSSPLADAIAELEPFKTAITLGFDRAWPYALYALLVVGASAVLFRGFCLYLCPLGAALALLGRARRFDWIPRRSECGSPCQLCKARCKFGAIEPKGAIKYDECFQCLDCVVIFHDPKTCVPEVLARRKPAAAPAARPTRPLEKETV